MSGLTKQDKQDLGEIFEEKLEKYKEEFVCPNGMTVEYVQIMKGFVDTMTTGKAVAFKALVWFLVISALSLFGWAFWCRMGVVAKNVVEK